MLKNHASENRVNYLSSLTAVLKARLKRLANKPILPRLLTYCVTYRCNCRCVMCELYKETQDVRGELTAKEIDTIFADKAFSALEVVRFTGGEPFLKEDIGEIVASINKRTNTKVFYITSNGALTQRIKVFIEQVVPLGIYLHVQISLDAASPLHDEIRNVPGLFNKTYETLEMLRSLREKYQFEVGINQTIMTTNISEMERVHRLAQDFGFGHNITLAAQYHEGRIAKSTDLQDSLPFAALEGMDEATIRNIYDRINAMKHDQYNHKVGEKHSSISLRDLVEAYLNEGGRNRLLFQKEIPKPLCTAFFTHLRLLPCGELVSCSIRRKRIVGNLRNASFSEIWWSDNALKERKSVKACKGCWSECDITPSIFYSGDIIGWYLKRSITKIGI